MGELDGYHHKEYWWDFMERLCDVKGSLDRLIVTCRCIWRPSWCCSYNHVINVVPGSSSQPPHVCRVKCNIVRVKRRPGRISGSISLGIPGFICCSYIYLFNLSHQNSSESFSKSCLGYIFTNYKNLQKPLRTNVSTNPSLTALWHTPPTLCELFFHWVG